jgi:hypothetical protein
MLPLAGINIVAVLLFGGVYCAAATQLLSQGAFLATVVVLFVALTALWIRIEGRRSRSRDPLSRLGRIAVGLLVAVIAVPGLTLTPLFTLQRQLPAEVGVEELIPGVMVILLASLALGALVNVAGAAITIGRAMVRWLRARSGGQGTAP